MGTAMGVARVVDGAGEQRTRAECSVHGKTRSTDCLQDDGAGGFCCKSANQCKQSGDMPNWAKNSAMMMPDPMAMQQMAGMFQMFTSMMMGMGGMPGMCDTWKGGSKGLTWGNGGKGGKKGGNLPRKRIYEWKINGQVSEWKGKFGFIQPSEPVDHPLAAKTEGNIYVRAKDIVDASELQPGSLVEFYLYSDASGLGAEECVTI